MANGQQPPEQVELENKDDQTLFLQLILDELFGANKRSLTVPAEFAKKFREAKQARQTQQGGNP